MKIITATMASNIANDFLNNDCAPVIRDTMDRILTQAEKGEHSTGMFINQAWSDEKITNLTLFFLGLGYKVEKHPTFLKIVW